mgnify:CR=1 FL=1
MYDLKSKEKTHISIAFEDYHYNAVIYMENKYYEEYKNDIMKVIKSMKYPEESYLKQKISELKEKENKE